VDGKGLVYTSVLY